MLKLNEKIRGGMKNDQKPKKKLATLATTSQGKRKWLFYAKKVVLLCEETART
jgi:hypothetical protein